MNRIELLRENLAVIKHDCDQLIDNLEAQIHLEITRDIENKKE